MWLQEGKSPAEYVSVLLLEAVADFNAASRVAAECFWNVNPTLQASLLPLIKNLILHEKEPAVLFKFLEKNRELHEQEDRAFASKIPGYMNYRRPAHEPTWKFHKFVGMVLVNTFRSYGYEEVAFYLDALENHLETGDIFEVESLRFAKIHRDSNKERETILVDSGNPPSISIVDDKFQKHTVYDWICSSAELVKSYKFSSYSFFAHTFDRSQYDYTLKMDAVLDRQALFELVKGSVES